MQSGDALRPIPRRAHKKSKLGCKTCKIRKVKCDERRPLCRNCERHFTNIVQCDFDELEPVLRQVSEPSTASVASAPRVPVQAPPNRRALPLQDPSSGRVGRLAEPLSIPPTVAAGRLDPFDARPVSDVSGSGVDALMSHYLSDFAFRSFPFYASKPLIEVWWPFVRQDDLLFNVVLLLSSADRATQQSRPDGLRNHEMLGQCLQLLNRRVQDPVASLNDHTIVSIACLAALEHDKDNMKALAMHISGLKQVVRLRGGLDAIRASNPMVANLTFWLSMISINEPSSLPLSYGDLDRPLSWFHEREALPLHTHSGSLVDLRAFGVDVPTANILHEVQRLSRMYTAAVDYGSPAEATHVLSHLCSIVDRLLRMSKAESTDSPVPGLSRSCRLAGCLHVFNPMTGYFPDPTLLLHTLTRDLKSSLTLVISSLGTSSHLLLWLLAVGGITAHAMPERAWFVGHLVVAVTDLAIESWERFRQYLVQLAFHDNFCDLNFGRLWGEVQAKRVELQGGNGSAGQEGLGRMCTEKLREG